MFRELMSSSEGDAGDISKNFCIGATFLAGQVLLNGQTVAIDTTNPSQVIAAASDDALRRAVVGIALAPLGSVDPGQPVQVAMMGRVAEAQVTAGLQGAQLFTGPVVSPGTLTSTLPPGLPKAIATALASQAGGIAPVWIGPAAV